MLDISKTAVLLQCSLRTLQTLRENGNGPDYFKLGVRMSCADSPRQDGQTVLYRKQDVVDWFKENKLDLRYPDLYHQASALKRFDAGQWMLDDIAYWVDPEGCIGGPVEESSLAELAERIESWDVDWLPPVEAALRKWSDPVQHKELSTRLISEFDSLSARAADIARAYQSGG
ncbi:hypothetical protein SAMN05421875_1137 [Acidovorax soli]|uniref:Uncharacterized protein n=2 Tax=Acidovorax soli TaxID=592050 RepID=A0A1H4B6A9_9BURK|nr:hypothetical protein SAMN05421875_1137 [Acidovorax soli]